MSEHIGVSHRTGNTLSAPPFSSIRNHLQDSDHNHYKVDIDQFEIIDRANTVIDLNIKESIHIKKDKPNLNVTDSIQLCLF